MTDALAVARPPRARLPAALIVALVLAGCGTAVSPSPATPVPSSSRASGSGGPETPRPTAWAGSAALGIEALGAADGEIRKGMAEFNAGVQAADPALMREAAIGLSGVDVLLTNLDRIEAHEPMRPFAAAYRAAITQMASATRDLRAALESGDAEGTTAASRRLVDSFTQYVALQPQLAEWVYQIPEQKRILVR